MKAIPAAGRDGFRECDRLAKRRRAKKSSPPVKKRQPKSKVARRISATKAPKKTKLQRVKPAPKIRRIKKAKLTRLTKADQRDPRKVFRFLRALGLTSSKRDSRKIKKDDKAVAKLKRKYGDVIEGKAKLIKISAKEEKAFRKQGRRVAKRKLIVTKQKRVTIRRRKKLIEQIREVEGGKIITILTPYSFEDLQQGLDRLEQDKDIQDLLGKGWKLALKFKGNWSYGTLPNIELLRDYLERYPLESVGMAEALELMLFLVNQDFSLPSAADRRSLHLKRQKAYRRAHPVSERRRQRAYDRNYQHMKNDPVRWAKHKADSKKYYQKHKRKILLKLRGGKPKRRKRRKHDPKKNRRR